MSRSGLALAVSLLLSCGGAAPPVSAPQLQPPAPGEPQPDPGCLALRPAQPGTPVQLRVTDELLAHGARAFAGDVDGTGKVAIAVNYAGASGSGIYLGDSRTGEVTGKFGSGINTISGQESGFIGEDCLGGGCFIFTFGLSATGETTFTLPGGPTSSQQARNPLGGVVRPNAGAVESLDGNGKLLWSQTIPGTANNLGLAVDRTGNTLAIWTVDPEVTKPMVTTLARWFDGAGNPGPVFTLLTGSRFVSRIFERAGSGFFVKGDDASSAGGVSPVWFGQLDSGATQLAPAPDWLAARPGATLHPVHGGTGYAVLPPGTVKLSVCTQQIEVFSAGGSRCGAAEFPVAPGPCTNPELLVGYDGTVVQTSLDVPACTDPPNATCTVGYQAWPGFFR